MPQNKQKIDGFDMFLQAGSRIDAGCRIEASGQSNLYW